MNNPIIRAKTQTAYSDSVYTVDHTHQRLLLDEANCCRRPSSLCVHDHYLTHAPVSIKQTPLYCWGIDDKHTCKSRYLAGLFGHHDSGLRLALRQLCV